MFDIWVPTPWNKKKQHLPVLGELVPQEDYDNITRWYQEKLATLIEIGDVLAPFASAGSNNENRQDTPLELAYQARDLLTASTATIKRLNRDNQDLLDQLDTQRQEIARLKKDMFYMDVQIANRQDLIDAYEDDIAAKEQA